MKIIHIVGTRPQFIKVAPVSRAIEKYDQIIDVIVHTGQHYDANMSQVFFDELQIKKPKYNLGVESKKHGEMTGAMLAGIELIFLEEKPDWVLIYGDCNSTLAGALAAAKLYIPIAHTEAGLRSFNRRMPEEINRIIVDHISNLLFCPTETAVRNLENEGITDGVFLTGDVMYDSFFFNKELSHNSNILSELKLFPGSYYLGTIHRQENIERLPDILDAFEKLSNPNCPFIIPLHPRIKKILERNQLKFNPHLRFLSPVSYLDMLALEAQAKIILTDSGGVQKEAYFSKIPCITLRDETEWIETVEAEWNYVAGTDPKNIIDAFQKAEGSIPKEYPEIFGDGHASEYLINIIVNHE